MQFLVFSLLSLALSMPAWPQDAAILHTGDTRSFLEVCGCSDEQLGGVARRGALIDRQRATGNPLLLVDAGGFVDGEEELDRLRVRTYARAMVQLGYAALNLAESDFHLGPEFLTQLVRQTSLPLVSTNLRQPLAGMAPYLVRPLGRWQVGILGVAPQSDHFVDPSSPWPDPSAAGQVDYRSLLATFPPLTTKCSPPAFPAGPHRQP
jgi:2',3'-cyclic-nucleotide 2'-phosphodiesterase (5'-nucleotidase family)